MALSHLGHSMANHLPVGYYLHLTRLICFTLQLPLARFELTSSHRWGCRTVAVSAVTPEAVRPSILARSPNPCLDKSINNPLGKVHCQPSLDPVGGSSQQWQMIQRQQRYAIDAYRRPKTDESEPSATCGALTWRGRRSSSRRPGVEERCLVTRSERGGRG